MTNTPYDDVFRTLLNDCSFLVLPMLNEVFGEHYTGKEEITFFLNEHFINQQEGTEEKRITDTFFAVSGVKKKKYHWECESKADKSILARFFEYDAQIALDSSSMENGMFVLEFPHSAVLILRGGNSMPDKMRTKIKVPGGEVEYDIEVLKIQLYSMEALFKKNLLFLLPFYIFNYESELAACEIEPEKLAALGEEYIKARKMLEKMQEENKIDIFTKCTLMDMSNKVAEHIAAKYSKVKEGVKKIMTGQILEYEAKIIKNQGRAEGIKSVIIHMYSKGFTLSQIAMATDKDESEIRLIIENE
ncbi:MAG: hypothetical protein K1W24_03330 [Lachnospiraceae bacterium]